MSWTTIESDPGVFTSLVQSFGVSGVEFEEVFSLDFLPPSSFGLIFLFKYSKAGNTGAEADTIVDDPDVWFAKQTVQNACATQAILGVLLNTDGSAGKFDLGDRLGDFKSFTSALPSDMKGESIGASDDIRVAHNSFTRPDPFVSDEKRAATDDDDVFHFIAYVPVNGKVYELDGLKSGPVFLGGAESNWQDVAKSRIQARITRYSESEIKFNVLSVVPDKALKIQEELKVEGADVASLQVQLEDEQDKRKKWDEENVRRKHNYVPFVIELVKALAGNGQADEMLKRGAERRKSKAGLS
ncbi:hypothetical protein TrLO_g882 [Triparma laevis f. longispina]|uniref:Ubiquitin carboxyl-terminal hydrolase n=1 Tax=Triparma laevis f. longispina TaxID=1714387 RepID=A0A9W6Z6K4_9STRA|nr:hypothetical protein TrLO_g882 [Triparma laevis f. longispina]